MHTLVFQHTKDEVPGTLVQWLKMRGHSFEIHHWYLNQGSPQLDHFDSLVVLGGPMNLDEEETYPWLKTEKQAIKSWLTTQKPYLGICLGGQLLAQTLGGRVEKNREREIGFCDLVLRENAHPAFQGWPENSRVYQYHEDRFTLPPGCTSLATSPGCEHQAFALNEKTMGLQFHPESTAEWIRENYPSIITNGKERFVQPIEETEAEMARSLEPMTANFFRLLDAFFSK